MPIYRVTLDQLFDGQQIQNVIHFSHFSSDPATMSALADAVEADWVNNVRIPISAGVRFVRIRVRMLESQFATFEKTINIAGAFGDHTQMHTFVAYLIRLRTATFGRAGRGRVYQAGVLPGNTERQLIPASKITEWNLRFVQIMNVFGPGGSSDFRLGVCNAHAPFDFKEVTSMSLAPTLGVQRRRKLGVGI